MTARANMTEDERDKATWELAQTAFNALGDGFEQLHANANVALSAMTYFLASAASNNGLGLAEFLRGCEVAYLEAQSQACASIPPS